MPLYMDIHTVDSPDFSVEDVVKAHMEDLAIQKRFGVTQIKYWVNVDAKTLFCLMEGPNREACNEVHKESHGNTACNIIEVADNEFNLFMGEGKDINDLAHTNSDEIDTGYRTILLLSIADLGKQFCNYLDDIRNIIKGSKGSIIIQPDDEIMLSFVFASDGIKCAKEINNLLSNLNEKFEYSISISSGRPVDEVGNDLFEETKIKVQSLSKLFKNKSLSLDFETKKLADKEQLSSKTNWENFNVVKNHELSFITDFYTTLRKNYIISEFNSENLTKELALSKSQVYRKIKKLTGFAPNQIIQEFRLKRSLSLLKNNDKTISEVAFDVGFNSPTYFAKLFHNRFNITPSDFTKS